MTKNFYLSCDKTLLIATLLGIFFVLGGQSGCAHISNHGFLEGEPHKVGEKKNLIVFIHGVNGSIEDTWGELALKKLGRYDQADKTSSGDWLIDCSGEEENSWPCLMKEDNDFKKKEDDNGKKNGYDFFVASYRSSALSYSSNISEIANRLLNTLIDRRFFEDYEQIHFVVHSMGGLIAKRMLIQLNQRNDLKKLYTVRSVIFLGTPAQGSGFAAFLNYFSRNPQFGDMEPADVNTYIQTLDHDWQVVLRRRAAEGASYPLAYCGYETLPILPWVPWSTIVKFSQSQSFCDESPVGFDRNHLELVKPGDSSTEPYQWVKARIREAEDKPGLFNQKVVIMDGSHRCIVYDNRTYDEGGTNGDDIADILRDLRVRTIKEHVHSSWKREAAILDQNPDLVIIHLSAFYQNTNHEDIYNRFQSFLRTMSRNSEHIKFLVYTRLPENGEIDLPEKTKNKYKELKDTMLSELNRKRERLIWWSITDYDALNEPPPGECMSKDSKDKKKQSFRNPKTRREFLQKVMEILNLSLSRVY